MSRRYDNKDLDVNIFLLFILAAIAVVMVVMWPKYADASDFPKKICVDNDWQHEGFNAYHYNDSAGLWMITYGHLIKKARFHSS